MELKVISNFQYKFKPVHTHQQTLETNIEEQKAIDNAAGSGCSYIQFLIHRGDTETTPVTSA